ncbi:hypothetical protein HUJ05_012643, partial [Dendroctonus ponderosae]
VAPKWRRSSPANGNAASFPTHRFLVIFGGTPMGPVFLKRGDEEIRSPWHVIKFGSFPSEALRCSVTASFPFLVYRSTVRCSFHDGLSKTVNLLNMPVKTFQQPHCIEPD